MFRYTVLLPVQFSTISVDNSVENRVEMIRIPQRQTRIHILIKK